MAGGKPTRFSGTPSQCPECGCVQWHVMEGEVNTKEERYVCMNKWCKCVKYADDLPPTPGYVRRNHAWHNV